MHARSVLLGVWLGGALTLQAGFLGPADGYNGFFFGDYTSANSDVGGKLAAGGNINVTNFGVASAYPANHFDGEYALVANGDVNAANGQLFSGNAFAGGTGTLSSFTLLSGSLTEGGTSPVDFATAETELKNKSQALKDLSGTAVSPNVGFEFLLDAAGSDLAVFLLDSSEFCSSCSVKFVNVGANTTVVVNVKGASVNGTNASYFINGSGVSGDASSPLASRILFNYFEATSLFMNSGVQGSVLAPYAAVTSTWGQMVGQLVAQSYSNECSEAGRCGSLELHDFNFEGDPGELPPPGSQVPEPATWMLSAAGLAGVLLRRMRTGKQ